MSEKDNGGPAFPTREKIGEEFGADGVWRDVFGDFGGMTMRDHFAAKAMQGLMARVGAHEAGLIAHDAYLVADAMLKAREA